MDKSCKSLQITAPRHTAELRSFCHSYLTISSSQECPLQFAQSTQISRGPFAAGQLSLSSWGRQQETLALPSCPERLPFPFLQASNKFFSFCNSWNKVPWAIWLSEQRSPDSHPENPSPISCPSAGFHGLDTIFMMVWLHTATQPGHLFSVCHWGRQDCGINTTWTVLSTFFNHLSKFYLFLIRVNQCFVQSNTEKEMSRGFLTLKKN